MLWIMACLALLSLSRSHGQHLPLYRDRTASVDTRVADLVARMTIEEKVGQLILPFGAHYPADYVGYNVTGLGATYPLPAQPGQQWWQTRNDWQNWQVNHTRLGIPTSFIAETLHSSYTGGTVFPMPCLQGSTWNTDLVREIAQVIAREARASGVDRGFSPVLHGCEDPRFGRCEESFGEDPGLTSAMGVAAVTGLAGPGKPGAASTYLSDPLNQIATEAKHFAAYGYGGRDGAPADMSEYTLYDIYLKPWYAYAQAGGRSIMAAHNSVNYMPCHGNYDLLTTALRQQFGFADGLCASDAGDIAALQHFNIVPDKVHAAAWAINAGMDQELEHMGAYTLLPQALNLSLVNMSTIDRAVSNVLRQKVASGLLNGRDDLLLVDPARQAAVFANASHRALALQAAQEGIVLLQNTAHFLPLKGLGSTIKRVAIIGPNADNAHSTMGGYTNDGANITTVLAGAVAAANASLNAFVVSYERGACLGATPDCPCPIPVDPNEPACQINDMSRYGYAATLASQSDVTILVLGDSSTIMAGKSSLHHETGTCGEHFDRDSLDLPGAQIGLLRAVLKVTSNVVLVLIHGRTATFGASFTDGFNELFTATPAVLAAWRPGQEAGTAIFGILNGTVNPSGRSAHTWPRSVGQVHQYVPWYLPRGARPVTDPYGDQQPATPLIPFGFGLSYTNFTVVAAQLSQTTVAMDGTISLNISISSRGPAGKVVLQVYFSQDFSTRVLYQRMLLGFTKLALPADSAPVSNVLEMPVSGLAVWDKVVKKYTVTPGSFHLYVGQHSQDPAMKSLSFTVAAAKPAVM